MNLTLAFLLPLPIVLIFVLPLFLGDARDRSLDRFTDRRGRPRRDRSQAGARQE
jgi:hypothetical protein